MLHKVTQTMVFWGWAVMLVLSVQGCPVGPAGQEPPPETIADATTPEPRPEPRPVPESKIEKPPAPKNIANGVRVQLAHVTDGDTLYLVTGVGGWAHRVRLLGVNAPECKKKKSGSFFACSADDDFFGLKSYELVKSFLRNVGKMTVVCKNKGDTCEKDDFDRYLVYLRLDDGKDLGTEVVRMGAAWSFTRYADEKRAERCAAEADAIKNKRGMWSNGRASVKSKMSTTVKRWYYNFKTSQSHDSLCSKAMNQDFAKAAGE